MAQNSILVDGQGQINRHADANGQIVGVRVDDRHIGYVCGDAAAAYGDRLDDDSVATSCWFAPRWSASSTICSRPSRPSSNG